MDTSVKSQKPENNPENFPDERGGWEIAGNTDAKTISQFKGYLKKESPKFLNFFDKKFGNNNWELAFGKIAYDQDTGEIIKDLKPVYYRKKNI